MSNVAAIIKAIRGWHKVSMAISATAILLMLSQQSTDFRTALSEAHTLRELNMKRYERFVNGFIGQNGLLPSPQGTGNYPWSENITDFLDSQMDQNVIRGDSPNPTWDVDIILEYERPPVNESVAEWFRWIKSTQPAEYYHPDWSTAQLSASRQETQSALVRHFVVGPSSYQRHPGEYTFLAYLDLRITSNDRSQNPNERKSREDWWSNLKDYGFRSEEKSLISDLGTDRWILQGDVRGIRRSVNGSSINHWLKQSSTWNHLAKTDNLGEEVLPGIREHWSQLEGMALSAAISYMERQHANIESVNLLGLAVPGDLFLIVIPLAYLLAHVLLLVEVRRLNFFRNSGEGFNTSEALWMGLYDDSLAKWTTVLSIAIIPVVLSFGLLLRYHTTIDMPMIAMCAVAIVIGMIVQFVLLRAVAMVRTSVAPSKGSE